MCFIVVVVCLFVFTVSGNDLLVAVCQFFSAGFRVHRTSPTTLTCTTLAKEVPFCADNWKLGELGFLENPRFSLRKSY